MAGTLTPSALRDVRVTSTYILLIYEQLRGASVAENSAVCRSEGTDAMMASNSSAIINNIISLYGDGRFHPDFGQDTHGAKTPLYGIPYNVAHGNTQAPEVEVALNSLPAFPHPSFYFRRVEQLRDIQVRAGDANRQIWLLEFGWTADKIHPNYAWFAVSEDKKAANIVGAFEYAKKNWSPWIGVMTLWTLADPNWTSQSEEYWWAIDNPDGAPRPAYTRVRDARRKNGARRHRVLDGHHGRRHRPGARREIRA